MRLLCILFCLSVYCPAITTAQETDNGEASFSSVLTIDISRIARETQYGQRIFKEFENAQSELIESNTIIQNNLEAEEQSLVELRKTQLNSTKERMLFEKNVQRWKIRFLNFETKT